MYESSLYCSHGLFLSQFCLIWFQLLEMNKNFAQKDSVAANTWKGLNISFQIKNNWHSSVAFRELWSKLCSQNPVLQETSRRLAMCVCWDLGIRLDDLQRPIHPQLFCASVIIFKWKHSVPGTVICYTLQLLLTRYCIFSKVWTRLHTE